MDKFFVRSEVIQTQGATEISVMRPSEVREQTRQRNLENEFFDFTEEILDPDYLEFVDRLNGKNELDYKSKSKLDKQFRESYGHGYEITRKMYGYELGKGLGARSTGLREPIIPIRKGHLGVSKPRHYDEYELDDEDDMDAQPNEGKKAPKITRDYLTRKLSKIMKIDDIYLSDQKLEKFAEIFDEHLASLEGAQPDSQESKIEGRNIQPNQSLVSYLTKVIRKFDEKQISKIIKSEEEFNSVGEKRKANVLLKKENMLLEEEIAQHNKIKHDLQYLSTLDLTNTESFAEAIKTMTEILLLFPQTFFALNLEKVSLKLMGDFFDQQNDANFDEFWTSHLEVLNSVCALTNYLDLNHAIYNAFDAHEQALSHGFFNFFFVTVAFPKFKRFIKQHWDHRHSNLLVHLLSSLSRPEMNRCSAKLAKHLFSNSILSFLTKHLIPSIESKDRLPDIHTHLLPWRNFTDKLKHKEYSTRVISSALKAKTSELWIKRELDIPELRALIDRSILLLEELDRDLLLITMAT